METALILSWKDRIEITIIRHLVLVCFVQSQHVTSLGGCRLPTNQSGNKTVSSMEGVLKREQFFS